MAILNKGDWVLIDDGRVGKILIEDYMGDGGWFPLVQVFDGTINTIRHRDCLTPIDPAFNNLLTDVNKESHEET
jgi:hypothetical protein